MVWLNPLAFWDWGKKSLSCLYFVKPIAMEALSPGCSNDALAKSPQRKTLHKIKHASSEGLVVVSRSCGDFVTGNTQIAEGEEASN